jgi:D-alanyl-D-alanine carboxypeptidase (penicillin-binding protein 5/6)
VFLDALSRAATPGRRRRRYRYNLRPLVPVVLVALTAFLVGAWAGTRGSGPDARSAAADTPLAGAPAGQASAPPTPKPEVKPQRLLSGPPLLAGRLPARLAASAAILVDAKTGRVLWSLHPHQRRPIASTTKIMTALLALRKLAPRDVVTVDRKATRVPLVREGLRAGEKVQAWKLFHALLLYSGNDDALALAIAAGGGTNKWPFIRRMNAEAKRLGMRDTHYTTPSGVIDDGNYSSAWDLAALTRVAMRDARFRKIVATKRIRVPWAAPTYSKIYVNNNRLLSLYRGATGVKTGYTHKAGWCLVSSATRGEVSLIAVVLDSGNIYADTKKLLDLGFKALGAPRP